MITIEDKKFKVGDPKRIEISKEYKMIYATGVDHVYASVAIYNSLLNDTNSMDQGPILFIIDHRNPSHPKYIPTPFRCVKTGQCDTTGCTVNDGEPLTSSNAITFWSMIQFHEWLKNIIGDIDLSTCETCDDIKKSTCETCDHIKKSTCEINCDYTEKEKKYKSDYFSNAKMIQTNESTVNLSEITNDGKNVIYMPDGTIKTEGKIQGTASIQGNVVNCSGMTVSNGAFSFVCNNKIV
ncbi:MAG TPA: hypothetical protein VLG50_08440 [Candidatus Saccharimonadales bacterium]|nr:hypothetical protein [Candidatus Saccharimonadales bacterium]